MKSMVAFLVAAVLGTAFTPAMGSVPAVRFKADKVLPSKWQIASVQTDAFPYGYQEEKGMGGLQIHLTGFQQVPDKGQLRTLESITLWFMPFAYRAAPVPPPGTPHFPAKPIGQTPKFRIFALPWNTTPTWQSWKADILKYYNIKPDSNITLHGTAHRRP